jgi:hypothetical protein
MIYTDFEEMKKTENNNEMSIDSVRPSELSQAKEAKEEYVPLSIENTAQVEKALSLLANLSGMISEKRNQMLEKRAAIEAKLHSLPDSIREMLNTVEYAKSAASVAEFIELLDKMHEEVAHDTILYQQLLKQGYPEELVHASEAAAGNKEAMVNNFAQMIAVDLANRVLTIRQYTKAVNRDLSISFSRYCFGFDEQLKQLDYLAYLARNAKSTN